MTELNDNLDQPLAVAKATNTRYWVLASLSLAATIAYVGRNCISVAQDPIAKDLGVDTRAMAQVMSAFFWAYALAQIPAGWLGHVWGTRRALATYAATWSLACAAIGLATDYRTLIMGQLVFGIAQAGIFPCCGAIIAVWISDARRALASGFVGGFQSFGGMIAAPLTGALLAGIVFSPLSWRWVFGLYALPGLLWGLFFFLWFRDRPEEHGGVNEAELLNILGDKKPLTKQPAARKRVPWSEFVTRFDILMIFGQQFFRAVGYAFFVTWFPRYLQETHGVTLAQAGMLTALPLFAVVIACPLGGWTVDAIYRRTGSLRLSRQGVACTSMLICAGFIAAAFFVSDAIIAVLLISAGSFWAAVGGPCGYTIAIDKGGEHVAPLFGAMNMVGNLGAALCPIVVAEIAVRYDDWSVVLIFFVGIYVAAAACWAAINPAGTIGGKQEP